MTVDDALQALAKARYVPDLYSMGVSSQIASLYNLSRCPRNLESGVSLLCEERIRMLVLLRDLAAGFAGRAYDNVALAGALNSIGRNEDPPFISYGRALEMISERRVSVGTMDKWVGFFLCLGKHEYGAVVRGYPELRPLLQKAREDWAINVERWNH